LFFLLNKVRSFLELLCHKKEENCKLNIKQSEEDERGRLTMNFFELYGEVVN